MPDTNDRYDAKIHGSGPVPEPAKVYSDRFKRCNSCPYPRHGLFCWTDARNCLRTEMAEIEQRSRVYRFRNGPASNPAGGWRSSTVRGTVEKGELVPPARFAVSDSEPVTSAEVTRNLEVLPV